MFELEHIKIPEGLVRKARQQGVYRTIMFWYKLKPIYKLGRFSKKDFYQTVHQYYQISDSNIRLHLNKLIELGLIKVSKEFYQLISYDKLFTHFNYDLSYKRVNKRILRKGNFAIDKVDLTDISVLEDRIDCGEIKLNIRRQEHKIKAVSKKTMPNIPKKETIISNGPRSKCSFDGSSIEISKTALLKVKDHFIVTNNQQKVNIIIGISCKGIAKLLGYKSTKSVHDLKYRAANYGLIHMFDQSVIFKKCCNILDEVLLQYKLKPASPCFKGEFGTSLSYQFCDNFLFSF